MTTGRGQWSSTVFSRRLIQSQQRATKEVQLKRPSLRRRDVENCRDPFRKRARRISSGLYAWKTRSDDIAEMTSEASDRKKGHPPRGELGRARRRTDDDLHPIVRKRRQRVEKLRRIQTAVDHHFGCFWMIMRIK